MEKMKDTLAGTPIHLDGMSIIPLELITYYHGRKGRGFLVYASKEPIGIVISSPKGKWAMDIEGNPVSLQAYIETVDGLGQILDELG